MIPEKMKVALEKHIGAEIGSAYLYLAMSAHFEAKAFKGFGKWMRVQFQEEMDHALKMVDYLISRGATITWKAAEAPATDFGSVLEAFEKTLAHERGVTAAVHALYELAGQERDLATQVFLQWFISEQVEEEARVGEIVDRVRLVQDRPSATLYLDKEYGKRGRE